MKLTKYKEYAMIRQTGGLRFEKICYCRISIGYSVSFEYFIAIAYPKAFKADDVLPQNIIKIIQQYIDGENIYIPKKDGSRVDWGAKTGVKKELRRRNALIYREYLDGETVSVLASRYYLSDKSIQRIIREMKICESA